MWVGQVGWGVEDAVVVDENRKREEVLGGEGVLGLQWCGRVGG